MYIHYKYMLVVAVLCSTSNDYVNIFEGRYISK